METETQQEYHAILGSWSDASTSRGPLKIARESPESRKGQGSFLQVSEDSKATLPVSCFLMFGFQNSENINLWCSSDSVCGRLLW